MDWARNPDGQWAAPAPDGWYTIRGGPGAWWYEHMTAAGRVIATGNTHGDPRAAMDEADRWGTV